MECRYSTSTVNLIQENPEIDHFHEEPEDDGDALSLCDLPLQHGFEDDVVADDDHDADHGNFEFSTTKSAIPIHNSYANMLFFGKPILTSAIPPPPPRRSASVQLPKTGKRRFPSRGISSNGMKYNVFIGVAAKFDPPRMELGEMRKRQNRKAPSPTLRGFCGEQQAVGGGKGGAHGNLPRPLRFRSNFARALTKISFLLAKKKPKTSFGCIRQYV